MLPCLDTGDILVVSGTCWRGPSLTHVDVAAELRQRSCAHGAAGELHGDLF